ncbi:hypothetical protein [Bradyrhizobium sp. STM 3809]|uniref:hypothetical protein n=1 Tax=Bradyrhizobium sp. STM 3809 TaxID=551936 RepID=UPI0002409E89|nr:hypothetical protein [Bradyrhizobium sp. STM 3809]CCE03215.1 conserved membrane hypothetical protein [Bradyrhizobium sp. STM 3809]
MADPRAGGSQDPIAYDPLAAREGLPPPSEPGPHPWPRFGLYVIPAASFAGAFLGCMATLHLTAYGLPSPLASAAVTLLLCAGLIIAPTRNLESATFSSSVYGGSFTGMTPVGILVESVTHAGLPEQASFFLLSAFCGLLFCIMTAIEIRLRGVLLQGYGGRLGLLAAVASLLFLCLMPLLGDRSDVLRLAHLDHFDKDLHASLAVFAVCLAGTALTLVILRLPAVAGAGRAGRTFVSAVIAFAGMAILQALLPDERCLIDAYYAGCFLGMSSPQRLSGRLAPVVAAATLTVLLVQAATVLPLVGGSLGFAAFVTVAVLDLLSRAALGLSPSRHGAATLVLRSLTLVAAVAALLLPTELFREEPDPASTGTIAQQESPLPPAPPPDAPNPPASVAAGVAGDGGAASATPKPDIAPPMVQPARSAPPPAKPRRRAAGSTAAAPPANPAEPAARRITRPAQSAAAAPAGTVGANTSASVPTASNRRAPARAPAASSSRQAPRQEVLRAQEADAEAEPAMAR